jgi:hypothetical protein
VAGEGRPSGRSAETILTKTKTTAHSSQRLRFGTPVSSVASLPFISSDGTKLSLERITSEMTSGNVATGQAHEAIRYESEASVSAYVSKIESGCSAPTAPFPASSQQRFWPFLQLLVGPKKVHIHLRENKTISCSCTILPAAKAWQGQDLYTNSSQFVTTL